MLTDDVKLREWLQGPSFLLTDEYPKESRNTEPDTADDEEPSIFVTKADDHELTNLIERCGTWSKLVCVTMNCLLFSARCRKIAAAPGSNQLHAKPENVIFRHCQRLTFPDEFDKLTQNQIISVNSKILSLNPYLDSNDDVLRARGRLAIADIPDDMKRPIILPANSRVTDLLITDTHRRNGHIGLKHMVSKLRERF